MRELFGRLNFFADQRCNNCGNTRPLAELEAVVEDGRLVGFSCAGTDEPTEGLGL